MGGLFGRRFKLDDGEVVLAEYERRQPFERLVVLITVPVMVVSAAFFIWAVVYTGDWQRYAIFIVVSLNMLVLAIGELLAPPKWVITTTDLVEMNDNSLKRLVRLNDPYFVGLGRLGRPRLERRGPFSRRFG